MSLPLRFRFAAREEYDKATVLPNLDVTRTLRVGDALS